MLKITYTRTETHLKRFSRKKCSLIARAYRAPRLKWKKAVENALKQGRVRIYDIGGSSKMTEMGTTVVD